MRFRNLLPLLLAACATAPLPRSEPIPTSWLSVPQAPRYATLTSPLSGAPAPSPAQVRIVTTPSGAKLVNGDKDLTPELRAIDSFDLNPTRQEIVFSAKRTTNFDPALVALEGSEIHWLPSDPADEVGVQWAPRGNRISYIVRTPAGDLVRTLQVTTAAQSTVELLGGRVDALAWEPRGETFAVSWESFDASPRVETMAFDGKERRMSTPPAARLTDIASEITKGTLIVRPEMMHYGEKLPLVVWRTSDRNRWSDARAKLQQETRIACAIVERDPDAAFWDDMRLHPWIDLTRVFVVNAPAPPGATSIRGTSNIESGHYRREGNTLFVPVDVVESFAAGSIAQQLKGSPPAHGLDR